MSNSLFSEEFTQATAVIHAGIEPPQQGQPLVQGPCFASTFHLSGDVETPNHQYGRFHNPTWGSLEAALAELEGGPALVFPSGMAAVAAILTALVKSGDTILIQSDGYYATRAYAEQFLVKFGVRLIMVPTSEIIDQDFSLIDLVFVESPSNPLLDLIDISELSIKAQQHGCIVAIDNTSMTPLGQNPLALGADISMCSDTKALNGHSDVLFGHIATLSEPLYTAIAQWRKLAGNISGPMETWLVQRGMATLEMRLSRMTANALKIAEYLKCHSKVLNVRYPGLDTDPSHALATKQMQSYGFLVSFDLGSQQQADKFLQQSQLLFEATSFGGLHTMAERRARWGTDDVSPGLVRLSVGCEHSDDILADINQALTAI
jgi:cystathionine gamma-lyase